MSCQYFSNENWKFCNYQQPEITMSRSYNNFNPPPTGDRRTGREYGFHAPNNPDWSYPSSFPMLPRLPPPQVSPVSIRTHETFTTKKKPVNRKTWFVVLGWKQRCSLWSMATSRGYTDPFPFTWVPSFFPILFLFYWIISLSFA